MGDVGVAGSSRRVFGHWLWDRNDADMAAVLMRVTEHLAVSEEVEEFVCTGVEV